MEQGFCCAAADKIPGVISLARYGALLQSREVQHVFAASLIGRLPIGVTGLAILLLVQGASGSFASGGATTGSYVAGLALVAPAWGRLIDRRGPRGALLCCGFLFPAALTALVASVLSEAPAWLTLCLAVAAGAVFPPITVCMRTYFRQRFADDTQLSTAYSLESVLIEMIFIVGPLMVALFVAFASSAAAVWFAAACSVVGVWLFLRSPALQNWKIEAGRGGGLFGPLVEPGFPSLIGVILCYSMAFGLTEIGLTAYATEGGRPALAGVLLGLMSAGSAVGGLAYGSRSWHVPLARQFSMMLAIMGIGLAVLAAPWPAWAFAAWSLVVGIAMAPALIVQSMLIAKTARAEHSTEAFTWSASALLAGVGIGVAFGGVLLEHWHSPAALAAGAASALIAALGALLLSPRA